MSNVTIDSVLYSTDTVGGVEYPISKIAYGAAGAAALLDVKPATDASILAMSGKMANGAGAIGAALGVALPTDTVIGGGSISAPAIGIDLLTNTSGTWVDVGPYGSISLLIQTGVGISAGVITFEQTNDTTVAPNGGSLWLTDAHAPSSSPVSTLTLAASTTRHFTAPIVCRYIRMRVTTAVVGGTVQAVATLSQQAYSPGNVTTVTQPTAANLQMTASLAASQTLATVTTVNRTLLDAFNTVDIASAAITSTANSSNVATASIISQSFAVVVTAVSGTTPTLDVVVQESIDNGTNWRDIYHFERITANGYYTSPLIRMTGSHVRYVQTVGGTTPSFTRSIVREQRSAPAPAVYSFFDRTAGLLIMALNAVTPAFYIHGATQLTAVVSSGAATTPGALQVEISPDGTNWAALGAPFTTVASTTSIVLNTAVTARYARIRCSTAGVSQALNYVHLATG